jgi:hypothetical protein
MKNRNSHGPYYRKFLVGNIGVEINESDMGGLWFHMWNCTIDLNQNSNNVRFHFDSEEQLQEFSTKIAGLKNVEEN